MESSGGDIEINGIKLIAILALLKEQSDIKIYENGSYFVPFELAKEILKNLMPKSNVS